MATEEDVKQRQIVETRARNISHNVRCTECGSQSIEDSQADVAILLRKVHVLSISLWIIQLLGLLGSVDRKAFGNRALFSFG